MTTIPQDLRPDYAMTSNPDEAWGPTFVRELIERIARLEAQLAQAQEEIHARDLQLELTVPATRLAEAQETIRRLSAPVTDEELTPFCLGKKIMMAEVFNNLLAARAAKEGQS